MILFLFVKWLNGWMDRHGDLDPSFFWYGMGLAFLVDVFLISVLVYWLRILQG